MQKHRKKTSYKKIVIGVGALAIVGVPTAAMACFDGQDDGNGRTRTVSHQQQRPWQWTPSATPSTLPPVDAPLPATSPSSSPSEASPSSPAAPAQPPVVETTPPAQPKPPVKPPVATKKPQAPQPSTTAAPPASGSVAQVLALVNQERAAAGCSAVSLNAKLTKAAQDHSADMASHSNMSHTGSDGSDPGARITRAGYTWSTYGENVAYGYSTPEKVMEGWMNSQGHRENILNCSFKEIGIGLAQPGNYWTQDFGTAR
ncbi:MULTISPECIES: CAP domain-containing protein [unclassified Streptomyces]|uniref:CAP domain-containing protein n=1 Tax=unclassified Streptomyces TaxID=2593676 RepID=UPI0004BE11E5|nr:MULTISPECIES: CAP domain-containing protein [unclassified Streptomyces]